MPLPQDAANLPGHLAALHASRDRASGDPVTIAVWPNLMDPAQQEELRSRVAPWLATWHPSLINVWGLEFNDGVPCLVLDALDSPEIRLMEAPSLTAEQLKSMAFGALAVLETLRHDGVQHGRICPDAFALRQGSWRLLPPVLIDSATASPWARLPPAPRWNPIAWVLARGREQFTGGQSGANQDAATQARQDVVALVRTMHFAAAGTDALEASGGQTQLRDLDPEIARLMRNVAKGSGPSDSQELRVALMGELVRLPWPLERPDSPAAPRKPRPTRSRDVFLEWWSGAKPLAEPREGNPATIALDFDTVRLPADYPDRPPHPFLGGLGNHPSDPIVLAPPDSSYGEHITSEAVARQYRFARWRLLQEIARLELVVPGFRTLMGYRVRRTKQELVQNAPFVLDHVVFEMKAKAQWEGADGVLEQGDVVYASEFWFRVGAASRLLPTGR